MKPDVVLLTTSEVAELFRLDQSTIRRWVDEKRIVAIQLPGGRLRYRRTDIEAILSGDYTAPAGAA